MSAGADHPLVVFGDDWGRRVSSLQHVFREIASQRTVIWINGIGHRIPRLRASDVRRAWEKAMAMLVRDGRPGRNGWLDDRAPTLIVQPRVLPWHHRAGVRWFNRRSLVRSMARALQAVGAWRPPVIVTGSPPSAPALGHVGEAGSIYFCMDDFSHLAGVSTPMLEPLERMLLERVDAVVATARTLTRTKIPRSGQVHYLPQGVNYEHFARPRPEPADLASLPRPIIGFAGGVSACCDLELLRTVARRHPHASVVLVGPVTVDTGALDLPGVHLLGPRPYKDLPAYVQCFDVALIPYLLNDWTRAVDPLKLLEYLAAGPPVVSTWLPEIAKYGDVVRIARDDEQFITEVSKALIEDGSDEKATRQAVARQNTWKQRARILLQIVDSVVEQRSERPVPSGS